MKKINVKIFLVFVILFYFLCTKQIAYCELTSDCEDDGCTSVIFHHLADPSQKSIDYYEGRKITYTEYNKFDEVVRANTRLRNAPGYVDISGREVSNKSKQRAPATGFIEVFGSSSSIPTGSGVIDSYATKFATGPSESQYFGSVYSGTEIAYQILNHGSTGYRSRNRLTKNMLNEIYEQEDKLDKVTKNGKNYLVVYFSKVYISKTERVASTPGSSPVKYKYNIDEYPEQPHSIIAENAFFRRLLIPIFPKKEIIVQYKYKQDDGTYKVEAHEKIEVELKKSTYNKTLTYDGEYNGKFNQKMNEGYTYTGVKVYSDNNKDTAKNKVDSSGNAKGWKTTSKTIELKNNSKTYEVGKTYKTDKTYTVVAFYFDKLEYEVNYKLTDVDGNDVLLGKGSSGFIKLTNSNRKNFVTRRKEKQQNLTIKIQNSTQEITWEGKKYKYNGGLKFMGKSLQKARDKQTANDSVANWGKNKMYTAIASNNWYGDGVEFVEPHGYVIEFAFEEGPVKVKQVYANHYVIDANTGEVIGKLPYNFASKKETIGGSLVVNGTDTRTNKRISIPSGTDVYFKTDLTSSVGLTPAPVNSADYEYAGLTSGVANTSTEAAANLAACTRSAQSSYYNSSQNKYIMVNFYYKKKGDCPPGTPGCPDIPTPDCGDISLVGRLDFKSAASTGSDYTTSTAKVAPDMDYIPSGKDLDVYIGEAYPYHLAGAKYEEKTTGRVAKYTSLTLHSYMLIWGTSHAGCYPDHKKVNPEGSSLQKEEKTTVTDTWETGGSAPARENKKNYSSDKFGRSYKAETIEYTDFNTTETEIAITDSYGKQIGTKTRYTRTCTQTTKKYKEAFYPGDTCKPYNESKSITDINKGFSYRVNYEHQYYVITNFKMYRIDRVVLHDKDTNTGGLLFGSSDADYDIALSSAYEDSVSSGGLKNHETTPKFSTDGNIYDDTVIGGSMSLGADNSRLAFRKDGCGEPIIRDSVDSPTPPDYSHVGANSECEVLFAKNSQLLKENLDTYTHSRVADFNKLRFKLTLTNDNFKIDRSGVELFQENKKEREEDIRDADTDWGMMSTRNTPTNYTAYANEYMSGMPTSVRTTNNDFDTTLNIPYWKWNGIRVPSATIKYRLMTGSNFSREGAYNRAKSVTVGMDCEVFPPSPKKDYTETSGEGGIGEVNKVNVLTPLNFKLKIETPTVVNHSDSSDIITLQKNAVFKVIPTFSGTAIAGYNNIDTNEFVKYTMVKFDFDITGLQIHGTYTDDDGNREYDYYENIPAGTWIKIPPGGYLEAKPTMYTESEGVTVDRAANSVNGVAFTINNPPELTTATMNGLNSSSWKNLLTSYIESTNTTTMPNLTATNHGSYISPSSIKGDAYHRVQDKIVTTNLGRIFDFKLTDCTDLNFKEVFRRQTISDVNATTGTVYFSGIKKLKMYYTYADIGYNDYEEVSNTSTILPLGPYKSTNNTMIEAPKLGYRVSFDLKTNGSLGAAELSTRSVKITPSYYYISKDGSNFTKDITLYYKNSTGQYTKFVDSGYKIYFKPNDGYRNVANSSVTPNSRYLSDALKELNISSSSGFILDSSMMDTSADDDMFIQAWYGEFKLPNSTIAVKNGSSINKPLTDGYIGVIFKIECTDKGTKNVTVAYDNEDKGLDGSRHNTSQWDYEGYIGFNSPGSNADGLSIKLEKGDWNINDDMYNKIKGTVLLYDTDNRAAEDFD